jgi:hypothetical protein
MKSPVILGMVALSMTMGCGNENAERVRDPDEGAVTTTPEATDMARRAPSAEELQDLAIGFGLPRVIAVNAYLSKSLVVEAVYQATALSGSGLYGQITNTGTLTTEFGGLQFLPQPADRLVVRLGEESHEFVVREAQGNLQAPTAAEWLISPHVLRYRHVLPGQAEVELAVQFDGVNFQSEVAGWYLQSGHRYDLDLIATGQSVTQRDMTGQEVRTEYDYSGTISREGFSLEVSEHHTFSLAAASHPSRLLPSQRGSASRFNGTINNVVRSGGTESKFVDVQVQTDMMARGGTGTAGLTHLSGQVSRDGTTLGRCVLQTGQAFLDTGSTRLPLDIPPPGG